MNDTPTTELIDAESLGDSVSTERTQNLRETQPHLFTGDDKAAAATTGDEGADAIDAAGEADADPAKPAREGSIPKPRFDEVLAERNALRDRLAAFDRAEQERTQQAAAAAAKPPRDFEAEFDALDAELAAGTMDADEHLRRSRVLDRDARHFDREEAERVALAKFEKLSAQKEEKSRDELFGDARDRFLADPANAAYKEPIRAAAMNQAMLDINTERNGKITFDDLLKEARDKVEIAFGGKPVAGAETAQQRVTRERREAAVKANAQAGALPERPIGGVGNRAAEAAKDPERISRAEWRKLPQAEKDRLLGKEPATN